MTRPHLPAAGRWFRKQLRHRARFRRANPLCWTTATLLLVVFGGAQIAHPRNCLAQEKAKRAKKSTKPKGAEPDWKPLFDQKTLKNWKITRFGGEGEVFVEKGTIVLEMGSSLTGITYTGKPPKCDYELRFDAMRTDGIDFFGTVTFPVNDACCSLVVGGWAGAVVGISCINGQDASENETTRYMNFKDNRWYRIRVQVRKDRIKAWIDDKQVVDVDIRGKKLETRVEVYLCEPLGIASYETHARLKNIAWRPLPRKKAK